MSRSWLCEAWLRLRASSCDALSRIRRSFQSASLPASEGAVGRRLADLLLGDRDDPLQPIRGDSPPPLWVISRARASESSFDHQSMMSMRATMASTTAGESRPSSARFIPSLLNFETSRATAATMLPGVDGARANQYAGGYSSTRPSCGPRKIRSFSGTVVVQPDQPHHRACRRRDRGRDCRRDRALCRSPRERIRCSEEPFRAVRGQHQVKLKSLAIYSTAQVPSPWADPRSCRGRVSLVRPFARLLRSLS